MRRLPYLIVSVWLSFLLAGCSQSLTDKAKEQTQNGQQEQANESGDATGEKYTLAEAKELVRSEMKEELREEIIAEERPSIEEEVRSAAFEEGRKDALKEFEGDIELVYDQKMDIETFLAKYAKKE